MAALCFGGSFNPIHHGHLICARAAAEARGFDQVVLFPTAQPPHKPESATMAAAEHRLKMCQLAAFGTSLFRVDDLELSRSGPSYTLDTARELKRRGWERVHWLIGADMLLYLPQWHQPKDLLEEVDFVIMARPGWSIDWEKLPPQFRKLKENFVDTPLIDIRGTEIRQRAAAGMPIDFLTTPAVCQYIRRAGLYQDAR